MQALGKQGLGWAAFALAAVAGLAWLARSGPSGAAATPEDVASGARDERTSSPSEPPGPGTARIELDAEPPFVEASTASEGASPTEETAAFRTRLHVVDAASGVELNGVDVLEPTAWEVRHDFPDDASLAGALVVDGRSPVELQRRWQPPYFEPGSEAERALSMEWLELDAPGRAHFSAPVGRTLVEVHCSGYDTPQHWVDLLRGDNPLELAFSARPTLLLGFVHGGELVPPPPGLEVVRASGEGAWEALEDVGGRRLGQVEEPGSYVVRAALEAPFVFEPRSVPLRVGERTELDVPVRRGP